MIRFVTTCNISPRRSTIFLDELIAFLISMPVAVYLGS